MNIYSKLVAIQNELKAPKSQYNSFGGYNYRSCEDILEALKPLLKKYECTLTISDEIQLIGERYYVRAVVTLIDAPSDEFPGETLTVSALAREEKEKKGMDASQITGSTSSYARKYALNGMFAIDDTKDADTEPRKEEPKQKSAPKAEKPKVDYGSIDTTPVAAVPAPNDNKAKPTESELALLVKLCRQKGIGRQTFAKLCGVEITSPELTHDLCIAMMNLIKDYPDAPASN